MLEAEAYSKACQIADMLLARGYPVWSYDSIAGLIIIRFGGDRRQTIHADADDCSFDSFREAYERGPPSDRTEGDARLRRDDP